MASADAGADAGVDGSADGSADVSSDGGVRGGRRTTKDDVEMGEGWPESIDILRWRGGSED